MDPVPDLFDAIRTGDVAKVRAILSTDVAFVDARNAQGQSAVLMAWLSKLALGSAQNSSKSRWLSLLPEVDAEGGPRQPKGEGAEVDFDFFVPRRGGRLQHGVVQGPGVAVETNVTGDLKADPGQEQQRECKGGHEFHWKGADMER